MYWLKVLGYIVRVQFTHPPHPPYPTRKKLMTEKIVLTETKWEVQLPRDENGLTSSAEFDTEENARTAWAENQPSLLIKTVTETSMRGEVLAKWEARS